MSNPTTNTVTYREVKGPGGAPYWIAEVNGKQVAKAMSEQGVRSLVTSIIEKDKYKQKKVP